MYEVRSSEYGRAWSREAKRGGINIRRENRRRKVQKCWWENVSLLGPNRGTHTHGVAERSFARKKRKGYNQMIVDDPLTFLRERGTEVGLVPGDFLLRSSSTRLSNEILVECKVSSFSAAAREFRAASSASASAC